MAYRNKNKVSSDSTVSLSSDENDYSTNGDVFYGEVLQKKYLLIKKIGYGSCSSVWLSYNIDNQKFFALKIQNSEDYEEGKFEVEYLKDLKTYSCQTIANLLEDFKIIIGKNKYICMVFELMACTVYDIIREGKYRHGLPIPIVKRIIRQLLKAVKIMHNETNAIHKDLKPENLLIAGYKPSVKELIDKIEQFNAPVKFKEAREKAYKEHGFTIGNNKHRQKFNLKIKHKVLKQINKNLLNFIGEFGDDHESVHDHESDHDNESDNESDHDNESESSSDEDKDYEVIPDEFVKKCRIQLTDFGSIQYADEEENGDIVTMYYMAPESILKLKYNKSYDIWSIACIIYELLTGDILFDPDKDKEFNRKTQHIYWMMELLGDLPEWMIRESPKKKEFFEKIGKHKYVLKGVKNIERYPLKDLLSEIKNIDKDDLNDLQELMEGMLQYDPRYRFTIDKCISCNWLNN